MKKQNKQILSSLFILVVMMTNSYSPAQTSVKTTTGNYQTTGYIEKLDAALDRLLDTSSTIEIIAEGFDWSEGPLWVPQGNYLLFSDIPPNKIYRWDEKNGLKEYLQPSGYTGTTPRSGERGSNGLLFDKEGRLVLCQHGDRRMARMNTSLDQPQPNFITLVDKYGGKRLNSPNDAVYRSNGDLYFTDPPYGLEKNMDDPAKELPFQGVFRVTGSGKVELLTKELSRPNGIAFSPNEKKLYVANSDPDKAIWMIYDVATDGTITNGKIFYDVTEDAKKEKGLPDGMKLDKDGNIFATGPGGVWIFDASGKLLGKIKTGQATSNCAFNPEQTELFITADMYVLKVKLKKK